MKRKQISLLCLVFAFLIAKNAFTQDFNPLFDKITVEDGLSNGLVTKIFQDSKGFMWFCTFDGLNKYDGYTFTIFKNDETDSTSINHNLVWDIFENTDGVLWAATQGGVNLYDPKLNRFSVLEAKIQNKKQAFKINSRNFLRLSADSLLIGTVDGVWLYSFKNKTCRPFPENANIHAVVHSLRLDKDRNVWISTDLKGLFVYNLSTKALEKYANNPNDKNAIRNDNVRCTFEDSYGNIWVGTESGLERFLPKTKNFQHYTYNPQDITGPGKGQVASIFQDAKKRVWIGFQYGLALYDPSTGRFTKFTNNQQNSKSIVGNEIWTMFSDRKGTLWIGTYFTGISKIENEKSVIKLYKYDSQDSKGLNENSVLAVHEDKNGNVWLGVDHGGLNYFDRKTGAFSHYTADPKQANSLSSDAVLCIEIDHEGVLWLGTWGGGISTFDPKTKKFTTYKPSKGNPGSLSGMHIWHIHEDKKHNIWAGSHEQGLNLFDRKTKTFKVFKHNEADQSSLSNDLVWDIIEDAESNIWIATAGGLNKFCPETNSFKRYFYTKNEAMDIFCLYCDPKNTIWLGTNGRGLIKFDPKTEGVVRYKKSDGLPSNIVASIAEDKHGDLWLGAYDGICWFNKKRGVVKNFDVNYGVQGNSFAHGAIARLTSGEIMIGGAKGFNIFHPDSMKKNTHAPQTVITNFKLFNKTVKIQDKNKILLKHINFTDTIYLNYNQSVFSIDYAALDFTVPEKNQYAYFLKGFDKEWNFVGNKRDVTYTNLDPGSYTFQVKGANSDGIWNQDSTLLHIIILPPWWMTFWFRSILFLLLFGSFPLFYIVRVAQIKSRNKALELQVLARTSELKEANFILTERQEEILQQNEQIMFQNDEIQKNNSALDFQFHELEKKNIQIETQNKELEVKNQHIQNQKEMITGSIRYASTIQSAIMLSEEQIRKTLDAFIILKPKDIVSGDFYWFSHEQKGTEDEKIFIAAVDCTGHGVPGAFMSMIGNTLLNEIVRVHKEYRPDYILERLDDLINKALRQDETENKDGMDVCLCRIDMNTNKLAADGKTRVLFAGSKRPLFYSTGEGVEKCMGTKLGLGDIKDRTNSSYKLNELFLEKGSTLYLTSDGYIDQNNDSRKRFGTKRFMAALADIQHLPLKEQKKRLEEILLDFQKDEEQRDDIVVIGVKL